MIVTFIGPPGSGKGTQAAIIASKFDILHLSTGEILRKKLESKDEEAEDIRKTMEAGKLVSSDVVNNIVLNAINNSIKGCILDGYPRNLAQANFLDNNCNSKVLAVYFDIHKNLLIQRISGRFNCSQCGKIYNSHFSPPKIDKVCDKCSSHDFIFRADDKEEAVSARLDEYNKQTKPLIDYYKKLGRLKIINAELSVNKIEEELQLILKSD